MQCASTALAIWLFNCSDGIQVWKVTECIECQTLLLALQVDRPSEMLFFYKQRMEARLEQCVLRAQAMWALSIFLRRQPNALTLFTALE